MWLADFYTNLALDKTVGDRKAEKQIVIYVEILEGLPE
jgi:hypothetical protein